MKRLTISMSDELFEKLDRIDNKSLFIRKLLERELEMLEDAPNATTGPWVPDINVLKGSVDELFLKLGEIEKHLNGKVVACSGPESTAELLASGSLISYKDRPLAQVANEAACPIIIPLDAEKCTTEITRVTAPELLHVEMDTRSSLHSSVQVPTNLPVETPELRQEPMPSVCENIIIPDYMAHETPAGYIVREAFECDLQADHSTGSHTPANDMKEQNMPQSQPAMTPEPDRQPADLSEPAQARPQPDRHGTPQSGPSSIVQDPELHKAHDSEAVPFIPDSNLHVIPLGKSASAPPAFGQQPMAANNHDLVMRDPNQHVVPVSEHSQATPSFNNDINGIDEQVPQMPLFDRQEKKMAEHALVMPAFGQHPTKEQELVMPQFKQHASPESVTGFIIPEINPQPMPGPETGFVMPEFEAPGDNFTNERRELITEKPGSRPGLPEDAEEMMLAMPAFNIPGQAADPTGAGQPLFRLHDMPGPAKTEKMPPFIAPPIPETVTNAQVPPFKQIQPAAVPPFQQQQRQPVVDSPINQPSGKNAKPGKLEGNILMYMPRGAKVKRSIIKSLVSKQFSDNEIEAKISELVSAGVLVVNADSGEQYLVRP
ncbi:hypothetical protein [Methanolobus chelungpuianus]|uniref:Uncharacterized protein n=1 Tax=Methanolobus chelungpuianus TaxID=502115 RepID=A0AAE3HBI3_9EURY|nr:hypothetical protein [Methanolobus chelungpuianus]MCQ6963074.1 hypothetical protein [Methanolobus chelungpuianus]